MLADELADLGFPDDPRDAALDGMEEMDITGCGFGRRAQALLGDDDLSDEARAEAIRDRTPEPPFAPLDDELGPEDVEPTPDPDFPETTDATRRDLPFTPPLAEQDLPDAGAQDRANIAAEEAKLLPTVQPPGAAPIPPPKITALIRQVNALAGKPVKPGTKAYYEQLAVALTALRLYVAGAFPGPLTDAWASLLSRTQTALDAALANPFLELPPIPSFWPALPKGATVTPIAPRVPPPVSRQPAYLAGGPTAFQPPLDIAQADVVRKIVSPPPDLTADEQLKWIQFYRTAPRPSSNA